MKKKIISIILGFNFLIIPLFSMEWGGILRNETGFIFSQAGDSTLKQNDEVYLWLTSPLGKDSNFFISAEGMYKFSLLSPNAQTSINNIADIDLLKIHGSFGFDKASLDIAFGRLFLTDSTGIIFNQLLDGAHCSFNLENIVISAFAGYTGLLNNHTTITIDATGVYDSPVSQIYSLAHPYVPFALNINFPVLFGNQSVIFEGLGILDLDNFDLSRYYATLYLAGPISNSVFYNASTTFGTVNFENLMNYTNLNIYIRPNDLISVTVGAEYASGKTDKSFGFTTLTSKTAYNSILYPEMNGVFMPKVSLAFTVYDFYAELVGKYVLDANDKFASKGLDFSIFMTYNLFSDLQLGFDFTSFIDTKTKTETNTSATIKAALAF